MRSFNITGLCVPKEDYMVDISAKLDKIIALIDKKSYFTINRARQYGKTTTLNLLKNRLADEYICASVSFEGVGDECFLSAATFCDMFLQKISQALRFTNVSEEYAKEWFDSNVASFRALGEHITKLCQNQKLVLLVDEVDKTSNNRTFLHFLGMLRDKYLLRKSNKDYTFHSVILVGVYDIKNIKLKLVNEGLISREDGAMYNSPWNIATNFNVDMSFNPTEIASMLTDYEADHKTNMDIGLISEEIYKYTSGYPFLVSRICKCIDEELENKDWTVAGIQRAISIILVEKNTLFDDLAKNLENNKEVYELLYALLINGERRAFTIDVPVIEWCSMFGYVSARDGATVISNKIFEIRMSNYFIAKNEVTARMEGSVCHSTYKEITKGGVFNMELALNKFAEHYQEIYTEKDAPFLERHGRLLFLSYIKPLINGQGFYHIESQFTDLRRMDIVVDFGQEQFIVELKLWKGEAGMDEAYEQLAGYMESKGAEKAYLLTFDFRKEKTKERKAEWVQMGDRRVFSVVV
jgi:hypothetical protein